MTVDERHVAFALASPPSPMSETTVRFILERLVTRPDGVLELVDGGVRMLVALIEGALNNDDAAELVVLGVDPPRDAADATLALLERAIAAVTTLANGGPRSALHVPMRGHLEPLGVEMFTRLGFAVAYREYLMRTLDARHDSPPPPALLRWIDLDTSWVDAVRPMLIDAFAGVSGVMFASPDDMAKRLLAHTPPARLLVDERTRELAGIARVILDPEARLGRVDLIARAATRRGGLGQVLLGEAMRVLAEAGMTRFELDVVASNERALDLYRRNGFAVVSQDTVWSRPLTRGAPDD